MRATLQADEKGILHVPPALLPNAGPSAIYKIDLENGSLIVSNTTEPSPAASFGKTQTPEERADAFLRWVESLPPGPGLPDHAVSRDSIYD